MRGCPSGTNFSLRAVGPFGVRRFSARVPGAGRCGHRTGPGVPRLERADVLRLQALLALGDLELDLLALFEGAVAAAGDGREVCEHVLAAVIGGDESKALFPVEPLDRTCCHQLLFPAGRIRGPLREALFPPSTSNAMCSEPGW